MTYRFTSQKAMVCFMARHK